jgi:predicted TIM-barrel fold metal-dependent hydrolase
VRIQDTLLHSGARLVIDHFGEPDPSHGIEQPGFQVVLALGRETDAIVKLSAPFRTSAQPFPHSDVELFVAAVVDAFGVDRASGFDWPSSTPRNTNTRPPNALDALAANPATASRCWHSPARSFGF